MNKKLQDQPNELHDSAGRTIIVCVMCELDPDAVKDMKRYTRQAITTVAGLAVCREHLLPVTRAIIDRVPMETLLADVKLGRYSL